jgi:hypothetical protein
MDIPEGGYKAEALRMRAHCRMETAAFLANLPRLDPRGASAEVRSIAVGVGIPPEELHPFDHRRQGGKPICEFRDEELHEARRRVLPRRHRG